MRPIGQPTGSAEQAARRLRELMTTGLESGPAEPLTKRRIAELREQALHAES